jgi:hypothetical protein
VSTRHPIEAGVVEFTLAETLDIRQMLALGASDNNLRPYAHWAGI